LRRRAWQPTLLFFQQNKVLLKLTLKALLINLSPNIIIASANVKANGFHSTLLLMYKTGLD
jgi:hypothetical protein